MASSKSPSSPALLTETKKTSLFHIVEGFDLPDPSCKGLAFLFLPFPFFKGAFSPSCKGSHSSSLSPRDAFSPHVLPTLLGTPFHPAPHCCCHPLLLLPFHKGHLLSLRAYSFPVNLLAPSEPFLGCANRVANLCCLIFDQVFPLNLALLISGVWVKRPMKAPQQMPAVDQSTFVRLHVHHQLSVVIQGFHAQAGFHIRLGKMPGPSSKVFLLTKRLPFSQEFKGFPSHKVFPYQGFPLLQGILLSRGINYTATLISETKAARDKSISIKSIEIATKKPPKQINIQIKC